MANPSGMQKITQTTEIWLSLTDFEVLGFPAKWHPFPCFKQIILQQLLPPAWLNLNRQQTAAVAAAGVQSSRFSPLSSVILQYIKMGFWMS